MRSCCCEECISAPRLLRPAKHGGYYLDAAAYVVTREGQACIASVRALAIPPRVDCGLLFTRVSNRVSAIYPPRKTYLWSGVPGSSCRALTASIIEALLNV